jgi:hypothetical protein
MHCFGEGDAARDIYLKKMRCKLSNLIDRLSKFLKSLKERDDASIVALTPEIHFRATIEEETVQTLEMSIKRIGMMKKKASYKLALLRACWVKRSKQDASAAKRSFGISVKKYVEAQAEEATRSDQDGKAAYVHGRITMMTKMMYQGELLLPVMAVMKSANPWKWKLDWVAISRSQVGINVPMVKEKVAEMWKFQWRN